MRYSKLPCKCSKRIAIADSFRRLWNAVDLRFKSTEVEAEFIKGFEKDILKYGMIACFMNSYCWMTNIIQTVFQEDLTVPGLLSFSDGGVKSVSIVLYSSVAICSCSIGIILLLRIKCGLFHCLQYEVLLILISLYTIAICICANKWHIAICLGQQPEHTWAVDRQGEEALILMSISCILIGCTFVPVRTCFFLVMPLGICIMYIVVAVAVGPTFPDYALQNVTLVIVFAVLASMTALRNEKQYRKDFSMAQEQKQTIQVQEVQIHEGVTVASCMEAVCESLCDIVIKLKKDLHLCSASQTAKSFFGVDLTVQPFTDLLSSSDLNRFKDLLVRVDAGALPQCLPVTLLVSKKRVNSSLLAVSTGVTEPCYLISVRNEQPTDFAEIDNPEVVGSPTIWTSVFPKSSVTDVSTEFLDEALPSMTDNVRGTGIIEDDSASAFALKASPASALGTPSIADHVIGTASIEDDAASALTLKTAPASVLGISSSGLCNFKPAVGLGMGNYTQVRVAGRGSQGVVFEVTDETGQRFALKRISLLGQIWQSDFPAQLALWDREVRLLKSMTWASAVVVQHQEAWVQDNFKVACIIMEWLPKTLPKALEKRFKTEKGVVPLCELCAWLVQMAFGIAAIHSAGWMHRDIKTNNMLLTEDEQHCKVADMGTGRPMRVGHEHDAASEAGSVLTSYTEKRGTLAYMSPEVRATGGHYCKPADIFGLGCVLLEMLVGESKFSAAARDADDCISQQMAATMLEKNLQHDCLGEKESELLKKLEMLCLQMLAYNAAERPTHEAILASEFLSEYVATVLQTAPNLHRVFKSYRQSL